MSKKQCTLAGILAALALVIFSSCPVETSGSGTHRKANENYAITFDANGGIFTDGSAQATVTSTSPSYIGRDYPKPTFPAVYDQDQNLVTDEQIFNGYFRSVTGTSAITENTQLVVASEDFTVYAHWQSLADAQTDIQNYLNTFIIPRLGDVSAVTDNLSLSEGTDLIGVSWESSDPSVVSADGTVTRPHFSADDADLTLTVTVNKGSVSLTHEFDVTVLKEIDYEGLANAAIDAAITAVTTSLGDLSGVIQNLNLPAASGDVAIAWASSNTACIDIDGTVTRPPYEGANTDVTLTATFTMDPAAPRVVTFSVTVKKMPSQAEEVAEAVAIVTANLGDLSAVVSNLNLPASYGNVSIIWESSEPDCLSSAGVVSRPVSESDVTLTLTGTFTSGAIRQDVPFQVTVLHYESTPYLDAKVLKAQIALGDLTTLSANITLPASDTTGTNLVNVSWSSSNTAVLSNSGVVTRPTGASNTTLTLTGTFTYVDNPAQSVAQSWPVRVMRTNATWDEFLNVSYVADTSGLKNTAYSGDFYQPILDSGAAPAIGTG
ncbi:MAG: InlB B-repeat-containing protein, partial [Treponema sp.]|nr:InlB B-repeat-containing protein [Treponema sp.]